MSKAFRCQQMRKSQIRYMYCNIIIMMIKIIIIIARSSNEKQDCIAILGFLMTKQAFSFVVKM